MHAVTARATRQNTGPTVTVSWTQSHRTKVLDFSLLQVTEVKNSNAMELAGLKRCLDYLEWENVKIAKLATDRHVQVRTHMKKERLNIKHNFDVWHVEKSVQTKNGGKRPRQWHVQLSNHGFMPS